MEQGERGAEPSAAEDAPWEVPHSDSLTRHVMDDDARGEGLPAAPTGAGGMADIYTELGISEGSWNVGEVHAEIVKELNHSSSTTRRSANTLGEGTRDEGTQNAGALAKALAVAQQGDLGTPLYEAVQTVLPLFGPAGESLDARPDNISSLDIGCLFRERRAQKRYKRLAPLPLDVWKGHGGTSISRTPLPAMSEGQKQELVRRTGKVERPTGLRSLRYHRYEIKGVDKKGDAGADEAGTVVIFHVLPDAVDNSAEGRPDLAADLGLVDTAFLSATFDEGSGANAGLPSMAQRGAMLPPNIKQEATGHLAAMMYPAAPAPAPTAPAPPAAPAGVRVNEELPVAAHVANADAFPDELPDLPDEESLDLLPPPPESTEQAQMGQPDPRGAKRPWYADAAGAPEAKRLGSLLLLGGFVTIAGLNSTMEEPTRLKSRQLTDLDSDSPFAAALTLEEPHVLGLVRGRFSCLRLLTNFAHDACAGTNDPAPRRAARLCPVLRGNRCGHGGAHPRPGAGHPAMLPQTRSPLLASRDGRVD